MRIIDGVRLHLGKVLHTAITIGKYGKTYNVPTKMATETGGGILLLPRFWNEDNKEKIEANC
jgi:hypothetical protein